MKITDFLNEFQDNKEFDANKDVYCRKCGEYMASVPISEYVKEGYESMRWICDKCKTFSEMLKEKLKGE